MTTLALLSGGLDSSTALYCTDADEALFVDYGQRHIREFEAAMTISTVFGIELHKLDLTAYGRSVSSALTSQQINVPHGHYAAENMRQTVVPGRNAVMLAAAAGIAASHGHNTVAIGAHAGDHPIYTDCRPEFISAMGAALQAGYGVDVAAPFIGFTKAEIVAYAANLGVPVGLTWSCYEGGLHHCGRCGTCVERAEAFALAGVLDPTEYADPDYWRVSCLS